MTEFELALRLPCGPDGVEKTMRKVDDYLQTRNVGANDREAVGVALREAVETWDGRAADLEREGRLDLGLDVRDDRCFVSVADTGDVVEEKSTPNLGALLARERRHKLGTPLLRRYMEEVRFSYRRDRENRLDMSRRLRSA